MAITSDFSLIVIPETYVKGSVMHTLDKENNMLLVCVLGPKRYADGVFFLN